MTSNDLPSNVFEAFAISLYNALVAVIVLTAVVLLILSLIEHFSKGIIARTLTRNRFMGYFGSAFLGLTPGCGGATFVSSLYVKKTITYGSLISAYITTIGDAAWIFFIINIRAFLLLSLLLFIIAMIMAPIIDLIFKNHPVLYFEHQYKHHLHRKEPNVNLQLFNDVVIPMIFWIIVFITLPATIVILFNLSSLSNIDNSSTYFYLIVTFGLIILLFEIFKLFGSKFLKINVHTHDEKHVQKSKNKIVLESFNEACEDTLTISIWLFLMLFLFQLLSLYVNSDAVYHFFSNVIWVTPLIAILLGLLPGDGLTLMIAMLYIGMPTNPGYELGGFVPFAMLFAIAFMSEGHAGYLLLVKNPTNYYRIKLIKLIPVLIFSYSFLLIEIYSPGNWPDNWLGINIDNILPTTSKIFFPL